MQVHGEGPVPCDVLLVAEGPGWEEDRAGRPMVGKTGKELNVHLNGRTLPVREDIFITNLYRLYQGKDHEWNAADYARDAPILVEELQRVQPKVIITMGRHSTRFFLGDVSLDDVHGIAWKLPEDCKQPYLSDEVVIFPLVHIAAGFHNPEMSGMVLYDFQELVAYFAGEREPRVLFDDPYPNPRYELVEHPDLIQFVPWEPIHIDSEGSPQYPWSVQWSQFPGEGYVIRATRPDLIALFGKCLRESNCPITYQGALHDLYVLRKGFGIETNDLPFDDTQVMAYLLQVEPRGLKGLGPRLANMRMQDYDDLMGDAEDRLAHDYFTALWDIEQADYEVEQEQAFEALKRIPLLDAHGQPKRLKKDGSIRYHNPKVLPKLPRSPLQRAVERGLRSVEPRKLWETWEETQPQVRSRAIRRLGFMPRASLDHVPEPEAIYYAGRDPDATGRVKTELWKRIQSQGLEGVYHLEMGTYPLIDRMHEVGMKPDLAHFEALSRALDFEIADLQVRLDEETGILDFNANSGDQVAMYLFDVMGLEGYKRTESGSRYSTNDKILEALEKEHPEIPVLSTIRTYRTQYKLKYTFVDTLPAFVHRWPYDGRVHMTFRTTRVVSGRLAASDPNGLAQPTHCQRIGCQHRTCARQFQRGWVAENGHLLGSWDLSQIELRVGAHLSQDPYMLAVYRGEIRNPDGSRVDLHAGLAERIFGVKPKDQDKSRHRLPCKAINFGFWMGQTKYGLMVELRKNGIVVDEDDAQRWLDEANALYKGAIRYKQVMIAEAKRQGFIRCLSGRIRYIGGIKSWDERVRSEAERFAFSTPIQEGAQMIMKQAEASIWQDIIVPYGRQGRYVQPLIQIHDAIDLEFEEDPALARDVNTRMVQIMERVPEGFSVPIETSGDYGRNLCTYDSKDPEADADRDMRPFDDLVHR